MLFSIVAVPNYNPINSVQGFPFLHIHFSIYYILCFYNGYSNRHEVIAHCIPLLIYVLVQAPYLFVNHNKLILDWHFEYS